MADAVTHSVVNLHAFGSHYSMCSSGSQCKNDVQSSSETQFWSFRGRQGSFSLAVVVVGPCIRVQPRVGPPRSDWLCNPSPELPIGRWETSPRTGARPLPVFALRAFAPSPPHRKLLMWWNPQDVSKGTWGWRDTACLTPFKNFSPSFFPSVFVFQRSYFVSLRDSVWVFRKIHHANDSLWITTVAGVRQSAVFITLMFLLRFKRWQKLCVLFSLLILMKV